MNLTEKLSLDSFVPICIIGKGSYAHVLLVEAIGNSRKKEAPKTFALKIVDKADIEFRNLQNSVYIERNILISLKSCSFATKVFACFQGTEELCYLIEYCAGGDMFELIQKKGRFSETEAKFYISQVVLALKEIHAERVVLRDLKPENILIDDKGYLKMADFGRSVIKETTEQKFKGLSGTPVYMAPEMVALKDYDQAVDLWSLGCLLYELLVGQPPFQHKNRKMLYDIIQNKNPDFPSFLSKDSKDLISSLLKKLPENRFSINEVIHHRWFKGFEWKLLESKKLKPPWKPQVTEDLGISNFNKKYVKMSFELITCGLNSGNHFENFYYESKEVKWVSRFKEENEENSDFSSKSNLGFEEENWENSYASSHSNDLEFDDPPWNSGSEEGGSNLNS